MKGATTPPKINSSNLKPWCFGSDDVSLQNRGPYSQVNQPLIFRHDLRIDVFRTKNHSESLTKWFKHPMPDPWDWYIYLYLKLSFMGNVGKYTRHGSYAHELFLSLVFQPYLLWGWVFWAGFLGSNYLLTRCLEAYRTIGFLVAPSMALPPAAIFFWFYFSPRVR